MVSGFHMWCSPSRRHEYTPPTGRRSLCGCGKPRAWRVSVSRASTSSPIPPMRDAVPVKWRSTSERDSPTASKIWAPQ